MRPKTIIIIQARMSSSRLPGKILMMIGKRPLLGHIIDSVRKSSMVDDIVIATSDRQSDDPVEEFCKREGVNCYRGSEDDVLDRFFEAAQTLRPDHVVRICGDQVLIDHAIIDETISAHLSSSSDYTTNIGSVPKGFDVEVMSFNTLDDVQSKANKGPFREHVTKYIYTHPEEYSIQKIDHIGKYHRPDIVVTIDTINDIEFVRQIFASIDGPHDIEQVILTIDRKKANRKPIILIRAEGSENKGFGDIKSLLNLSEKIDRFEIIFAIHDQKGIETVKKRGYEVLELPEKDELETIRDYCTKRKIKYCITQTVPNDPEYQKQLSSFLKVLMIDFFGNIEVYSDIVLNWDVFKRDYEIRNPYTEFLLGPDYVLVPKSKRSYNINKEIKKIAVSFGGSDPNRMTIQAIDALKDKGFELTAIIGPLYQGEIPDGCNPVRDPADIQDIFLQSDAVICGGGLTAFELCSLGIPFVGISNISWEIDRLKEFEKKGACIYIDMNTKQIERAITQISDRSVRKKMSTKGKKIVDGNGIERTADALTRTWLK